MTAIKICGITRAEDALAAARCGVNAIGLVFYAKSPRHVTAACAVDLMRVLPPFVMSVGLFVDAAAQEVAQTLATARVDLMQFHGDETPEYCRQFGVPYLKALRVRRGVNLLQYAHDYHDAKALLLDAYVEGTRGGTGEMFDWTLIPQNLPLPVILSGGLTPENVTAAVKAVRPWAVDVSSGVESSKGIKDAEKIAAFVTGVRNADV
ncbi:MAG TPA: phosphoribosylanthranilate isomerase [Burkholderiales bacterium]|nr:phosphoribosylanthranilate isomerase [Burkholderiales bacterium]